MPQSAATNNRVVYVQPALVTVGQPASGANLPTRASSVIIVAAVRIDYRVSISERTTKCA